jgi:hypothetical protein
VGKTGLFITPDTISGNWQIHLPMPHQSFCQAEPRPGSAGTKPAFFASGGRKKTRDAAALQIIPASKKSELRGNQRRKKRFPSPTSPFFCYLTESLISVISPAAYL